MPRAAVIQTARRLADAAALRSPWVARTVLERKLAGGRSALWELALLDDVPRGALAVDVGAHIGMLTRILADRFDRVLAVEPNPDAARRLLWTVPGNVAVLGAAVGAEPGLVELLAPRVHGRRVAALSSLVPGAVEGHHLRRVPVVSIALDQLELPALDLLKIDVEGFELEVLQGAAATMARFRPVLLVESEERHRPGAPAAVRELLAGVDLAGFFVAGGQVLDAAAFDAAVHQAQVPAAEDHGRADYANNFLFVPAEDADAWRQRLARAVRATGG